ncbi:hypothetical protein E1B28_003150 [Marasmius oreades]|uniref:Uncharacterized protein n=1 Tax=Marasmius oreades TaxID=181124 RepID=A0A9P7RL36_9AGAR|nr:uncharacterized protein E1B28_003150 [Marasmius oreades]KAG7085599.1 hypothetical protein E1B28_003150 [Marasmius oreades]
MHISDCVRPCRSWQVLRPNTPLKKRTKNIYTADGSPTFTPTIAPLYSGFFQHLSAILHLIEMGGESIKSTNSTSSKTKMPKFFGGSKAKSRSNTTTSLPDTASVTSTSLTQPSASTTHLSTTSEDAVNGVVREIVIPEEILDQTRVSPTNPALCEGW